MLAIGQRAEHDKGMSDFTGDHAAPTGSPVTPVYTLFAAFRVSSTHPFVVDGRDVPGLIQELEDVVEMLANENVTVRGWYDVSGMHHDADLLVWLHGDAAEDLQWGLREIRRSAIIRPLIRVSSALGLHSGTHATPALSEDAQQWLTVERRGPLNLKIYEADDLTELAPKLEGVTERTRTGRFIELVEIIEVLQ